jgi:hypothetical protein
MKSRASDIAEVLARDVHVAAKQLTVKLDDGRTISVPLDWYPRLKHGTSKERNNWELIADGYGIHWPDLDEDLSVEGILAGRHSMESQRSFKRWLERRAGKATKGKAKLADCGLAHKVRE